MTFDDIRRTVPLDMTKLQVVHLRPAALDHLEAAIAAETTAEAIASHHRCQVARLALQQSVSRWLATRIPFINPTDSFRYHREKGFLHTVLLRHGILTPEALVTSCAETARGFVQRLGGRVVVKPLASGAEVVMADDGFLETMARARGVRPYMFQRFVRGRSYRAYCLGGKIVSMGQVHFDARHVDWRERTKRVTTVEAPEPIVEAVGRALRLLQLPYCGVDIEHDDATDRDYLLDFNPAALFVGWSRLTKFDMAKELAAYLLRCAKVGEVAWC